MTATIELVTAVLGFSTALITLFIVTRKGVTDQSVAAPVPGFGGRNPNYRLQP